MPDGEETGGLGHAVAEQAEGSLAHAVENARALGGDVALNGFDQGGGKEGRHQTVRQSLQRHVTRHLL